VILGGKDKGSDYTVLRDRLHQKAHAALLIGAAAEKIASQLEGATKLIPGGTLEARSPKPGKRAPGRHRAAGPGLRSFDQFQSYEHAGGLQRTCERVKDKWRSGLERTGFSSARWCLMVLFGALMIYSASSVVADMRMGSSYYFALRQLIWIAIAIPLMMFMKRLNYRKLQTPAVAFTAMGLVMILLAVVYFADPKQHRWIRFGPFGGLQPSEFAKPALAMFLAYFIACVRAPSTAVTRCCRRFWRSGFVTMAVVVADLGTAIVLVRPRRSCSSWPASNRATS
jgi:hypothetical protein